MFAPSTLFRFYLGFIYLGTAMETKLLGKLSGKSNKNNLAEFTLIWHIFNQKIALEFTSVRGADYSHGWVSIGNSSH